LGYSVEEGDFRTPGSEITISRPIENSPHPLWQREDPQKLVRLNWSPGWEDEIEWVVQDVIQLIEEEDVLPEDILITYLWPYEVREERVPYIEEMLGTRISAESKGANDSIVHNYNEEVKRQGNQAEFSVPGNVTLSGVHYVGGNEANVVYVMGAEFASQDATQEQYRGDSWREQHVEARNKAFVAITRTKGWCRITGSDPTHRIVGELNRVVSDTLAEEPRLHFEVPPRDSPYKELEPEGYE
jgi:superfamily I DNA and RNA helicase